MRQSKRPLRSDPQLTAGTRDLVLESDDSVIGTDLGLRASSETVGPVVGRTSVDLLYDRGLQAAAAKLIAGMDATELFGTAAYVLLRLFSKSDQPVMRFWVFSALLATYHVVAKPVEGLLWALVERLKKRITK
jgi:hypothetical protein